MDADLQYKLVVTAATSLGGIVAAIAVAYGKMLIDLKYNREQRKLDHGDPDSAFTKYVELVDETYEHLLYLQTLGSARAMVLYTRNGGGIPRFDKPLKVSILREVYTPQAGSVKDLYNDVETDHAYDDMLRKLLKSDKGKITLIAAEMKDGMLKENYDHSGIAMSFVYYLSETSERLHFASFNFPDVETGLKHEYDCDMAGKALKRIFTQIQDVG